MYLYNICPLLYPRALSTPIWVLCSSIMRLMVVIHTRAATRKKNTGKTLAIPSTILVSFSKQAYPILVSLSSTYISGCSIWSTSFCASLSCALASSISALLFSSSVRLAAISSSPCSISALFLSSSACPWSN